MGAKPSNGAGPNLQENSAEELLEQMQSWGRGKSRPGPGSHALEGQNKMGAVVPLGISVGLVQLVLAWP